MYARHVNPELSFATFWQFRLSLLLGNLRLLSNFDPKITTIKHNAGSKLLTELSQIASCKNTPIF